MSLNLDDFEKALKGEEFEEIPVDLETFIRSPDYMGLPRMSDVQFDILKRLTQVYRRETLERLWGEDAGAELDAGKVNELVAMLGKGSGKNHTTITAVCRVVYLLLCLKDPAAYYGKPPGDGIHILNIAVNAQQAKNVFFNPLADRVRRSPWFQGKFDISADKIRFDKNVTAYSGHSEREAWEGYNLIFVVLDEIAAFKTAAEAAGGNDRQATAPALYKMYKASVTSRFPDVGKLALLSFSRFKGDFITERYEQVVGERVVDEFTHKFKLRDELPDGIEENEFSIDWEVDTILSYREPYVYAVKKPTWEVNPLRKIEDFKMEFWRDPVDALARYACMPPESTDAFFRDRGVVENAFKAMRSPFNDDWSFHPKFKPEEGRRYYVHCDLAVKQDRAAVAMCHVDSWVNINYGDTYSEIEPVFRVDAVRWWTPKSNRNVELNEVKEYILALRSRGFDIAMVSFDRWAGSYGLQNELARVGVEVETLSVLKQQYNDFALAMSENRIDGYNIPLLVDELLSLKVMPNGKIDHPRGGTNDLADALAGAISLAYKYEESDWADEIDIKFMKDLAEDRGKADTPNIQEEAKGSNGPMPEDIRDFLDGLAVL